jgi:hypothetical protein
LPLPVATPQPNQTKPNQTAMQTTQLNAKLFPLFYAKSGHTFIVSDKVEHVDKFAAKHVNMTRGKIYSVKPITFEIGEEYADIAHDECTALINLIGMPKNTKWTA